MTELLDRAAIKARAEAASAGPWELLGGGEYISPIGIIVAPDDGGVWPDDAEFIAHAREDIPALLAALEDAEREVAKITENRNKWASRMMELATTEQKLEQAERRIAAVEKALDADYPRNDPTDWTEYAKAKAGSLDAIRAALHPVAETTESEKTCPCAKCNPEAWWMILCPDCGNKRCPRAGWHGFECTHSNESGQVGTPTTESEKNDE